MKRKRVARRYRYKYQNNRIKPRVSKKLVLAAAASVLAVVVAGTSLWNFLNSVAPVEAQESFGGIGKVVENHSEGEPFVILDIVPGTASYNYTLSDNSKTISISDVSLGTMGYLTDGQIPVQESLRTTFENYQEDFYLYTERAALALALLPAGMDNSLFQISYKEGYAGVTPGLSEENGWIRIYDSYFPDGSSNVRQNGIVHAIYQQWTGGDTTGFDYNWVSGSQTSNMPAGGIAEWTGMDGAYHVIFSYNPELTAGYEAEWMLASEASCPLSTGVYIWDGSCFRYAGQMIDHPEIMNGTEEEEENPGNHTDNTAADETMPDGETEAGPGADVGDGTEALPDGGETGMPEEPENAGETGDSGETGDAGNAGETGDSGETGEPAETESQTAGNTIAGLTWYKLVFVEDSMILLSEAAAEIEGTPSGNTTPADTSTTTSPGNTMPADTSTTTSPGNTTPADTSTTTLPGNTTPADTGATTSPDGTVPSDTTQTMPETPGQPVEMPPTSPDNPGTEAPQAPVEGQNPAGTAGTSTEETPSVQLPDGLVEGEYYFVTFKYTEDPDGTKQLYEYDPENGVIPAENDAVDGAVPFDSYNFADEGAPVLDGNEAEDGIAPLMNEVVPDATFVYAGAGQGQYRLQEVPETEAGQKVLLWNAPTYFKYSGGNDWLERYVFHSLAGEDNESETFDIQVHVITADQVSSDDVMNADLVYLEAGLGEFLGSGSTIHYMTEYDGDMKEEVLFSIVYRAVNDLMPVIADYGILTAGYGVAGTGLGEGAGQGTDTGQGTGAGQTPETDQNLLTYQKLVRILLKKNLSAFYQDMENYDNMLINLSSEDHPDKTDNKYNYVNRNIYIVNGETLVSEDFYAPFDDDKVSAGFMEVLAALKAENSTLSEDDRISEIVSKARVMQYIINYAVGLISDFRDIRVLELQPTTNTRYDLQWHSDPDKDYTVLYWQKDGSSASGQQILRSSKAIDITVEKCSVAEFSGRQSDINNRYQMIFIGLDGQRLNYEQKGGKRYTVYNDEDMKKGLVYSSTGDIATDDKERYEGIDITPQKKDALIDFMKAGYPIVVEDDFFTGQTAKDVDADEINTDYVDSESQMYDFLRIAVDEYDDYLYTISDVHSSAVFAAQVNIRRPQIHFADGTEEEEEEDSAEEGGAVEEQMRSVQQIRIDAEGRYRGTVAYRIEDDRGEAYSDNVDIHVYLDRNQDGRFAPEEEIYDGFSTENGEFTIEFETPQQGILPWKLEVSDSGNSYRRDALTGFFEISYDKPSAVRILQIAAGKSIEEMSAEEINEAAKYNLALAYETADQTMLGHFLRNAEGLTNSTFEIKTMSAEKLAQQLVQNGKYLEGFDVLVLGFGPAENMDTVSGAVNRYIAEGRGVLMSSSAALGDTGRMGIDASLLGQLDIRTYETLGAAKGSQKYYRYRSMDSGMFGERSGMGARQINDGSISHYPFEIGESGRLCQAVKGGDYVLNLSANGTEDSIADVTAWYCLEDSLGSDAVSAYDISEKDAANNYYVYSRGNVIYIGEDYYAYKYEESPGVEPSPMADGYMECRLFVNAMMAAYNVGIKNPKVTIVAGLAADAPEIESICIPFDEQMIEVADGNAGLLDETTDVYFKIAEPNLAFNKKVQISFYYQDDEGGTSIDIGGESVLATPFGSQVWTVEENRLVEVGTEFALVPGKVYKIKAPVIPLRNESRTNADIYIVVQSSFSQFGQEKPVTGSDAIVLNRAQLFLLE